MPAGGKGAYMHGDWVTATATVLAQWPRRPHLDLAAISYGSCLADRLKDCAEMNDDCPSPVAGQFRTARPTAARCRGGEHNTDAVKTTALGGVGTLRPVRTAAADAAHRTSILESNARNSQRNLRDQCRPRCYGPSI